MNNLHAVYTAINAAYMKRYKEITPLHSKVATFIKSTTETENYWWLDDFPSLKVWVGEKTIKELSEHNYTIRNRDFEATIRIKKNRIADNQLSGYSIQAAGAGEAAARWGDKIVFSLFDKGFTEKCYDKESFFSDKHILADEQISNRSNLSLSIDSLKAAQASYGAAHIAISDRKNSEGDPLGLMANLLVVPPALQDVATALLTAEKIAGETNIYRGTAEILVSPYLKSSTAWYLLDTSQVLKPFVFQERQAPKITKQDTEASDSVFKRGEYLWGVEARGEAGFGMWQMAQGSTGTQAYVPPVKVSVSEAGAAAAQNHIPTAPPKGKADANKTGKQENKEEEKEPVNATPEQTEAETGTQTEAAAPDSKVDGSAAAVKGGKDVK